MANIQVAGFQPNRVIGGGSISERRIRVLTNNTTAIFLYDALKLQSGGDAAVASATNTANATVAMGAVYTDTSGVRRESKFLPAATLYTSSGVLPENASFVVAVENELLTEFKASIDEAIALTGLGVNYVQVLGAGSTTTGLSGHELDATGATTTATFPWRVTEFVLSTESDPDAADAHVWCRLNRSLSAPALSDGTGT